MVDVPVHDPRRRNFTDPESFRDVFKKYPLDKEFVDWVAEQGYEIVYTSEDNLGCGDVYVDPRKIVIGIHPRVDPNLNIDPNLVDLVVVHELIHIAAPDKRMERFNRQGVQIYNPFEKVIDEIAAQYTQDQEFMQHVTSTIPAQYSDKIARELADKL